MVLAPGVGSRDARRRRRGHGRCIGHTSRRARRRLERRRRDVTLRPGARLADVSGCDGGAGGDWRYRCVAACEHVCVRLIRGAAARYARWRRGRRVGRVDRRVWRRLGLRRQVLTVETGARLADATTGHVQLF